MALRTQNETKQARVNLDNLNNRVVAINTRTN